jgi:hypothetical protein
MPNLGLFGSSPQLRAFADGHVPRADRKVGVAIRMIEHRNAPALLTPALCGAAGLAAFLLLLGAQRSVEALLCKLRKPAAASREYSEQLPEEAAPSLRAAVPALVPAPEPRLANGIQRKTLHTAALLAIESRSLASAAPPRMLRRSSDYEGPRRRSTDSRPSASYGGPYRRTADSAANCAVASASAPAPGEGRLDPESASGKVVCIEPRQLPAQR